ncbi:acetyl-CoA synthetase-like protein [Aspergillus homomorphus CBS 101889]|uniref:Acetyl-CoA synthetase-like protein n=1 Tax=Aspergillus homomorphus (strain CBS 101889) TaxID=1450537 RepID=A0A395HXG7_ASPHC|nr:acetyl-CoA synthetase-like protein [Aspergillus homomorphus CBS 101889]RAL12480.1 acetyl-CoA synthetase-like protein [Aspergillus homomorphus CBS 101889]
MSETESYDLVSFAFNGPFMHNEGEPIFVDAKNPTRALSAGPFKRLVCLLIAGFKAHHVEAGDCVLVHMDNYILHSAVYLAIVGAGGVYMGCSPASPRHELEHFVNLADPRIILTTGNTLPLVREVCGPSSPVRQICLVTEAGIEALLALANEDTACPQPSTDNKTTITTESVKQEYPLTALATHGSAPWLRIPTVELAQSTPAAMFTTSGTSGLPKAAIRTHHTIISHHRSVHYMPGFASDQGQDATPKPIRRLLALPAYHSFGDFWNNLFPLRYGEPLYILPRFDLAEFVAAVERFQIIETYLVPVAVQMIAQLGRSNPRIRERLASLRYIGVSGAPVDAASLQRCQGVLHADACVSQLWGMTEVGVVFQNRYGDRAHPGSLGTLLDGYEVKLVDPTGDDVVEVGGAKRGIETGELYIRGPGVLLEYKGRSDDVVDEEGWFPTGDVVYEKDGHWFIVGRTKELIKVRGYSVAPAEIEALLLEKEARVADVAIIGVKTGDGDDEEEEEAPRAYVVRLKGEGEESFTEEEICAIVQKHLASYKALAGGVVFVDSIPRTDIGKPARSKLARLDRQRGKLATLLKAN